MLKAIKPKSISGKSILLLLGAVIFSLFILEIVCRLFLKEELPAYKPRLFIADNEIYSWCQPKKHSRKVINKKSGGSEFVMLMPNLFFAHEYPSNWRGYFNEKNRISYRNNNFGFRGRDIFPGDGVKKKNRRQIVLLGDSFSFGEGVYLKDSYSSLLESKLNQAFPHLTSQVINLSQPGLNTYTEYIVWDMHKTLVAPDLVIVAFNPCDILLNEIQEQEKKIITGEYLKMFEKPVGMRAILSKFKLYVLAKKRIAGKFREQKMMQITVGDLNKEIDGQSPSALCRAHFHQLFEAIKVKGSLFVVIIIPSFLKLEKDYPYLAVHNLVTDIGRKEGFAVIDLLPLFKGKKCSRFWVHPIDHHPNEVAHKMIADYLFTHIEFKKRIQSIYGPAKPNPVSANTQQVSRQDTDPNRKQLTEHEKKEFVKRVLKMVGLPPEDTNRVEYSDLDSIIANYSRK